jgi:hypothetical protein
MEEANRMAKLGLSGKQQKRLDELAREWGVESRGMSIGFHTSDLHLLLQHFAPLQQLIRQLAAGGEGTVQTNVIQPASATYCDDALTLAQQSASVQPDQQNELTTRLKQERDQRAQLENKLSEAASHLLQSQQQCQRLEQALRQEQALRHTAQTELSETASRLQQLEQQQRHHAELDALRQAGQSPVVKLLCQDISLATDLGLDGMGADGSADLERCVAVLSQIDTIRLLWDLLKARCEQQLRPATDGELTLLGSALAWHNHNWRQKPYQLYQPALASGFDFNKAQRAVGSPPSGESLRGVWLPGISDHAGRLQKKALVITG